MRKIGSFFSVVAFVAFIVRRFCSSLRFERQAVTVRPDVGPFFQPLEPRCFINSPFGPTLTMSYFGCNADGTMDLSAAAFATQQVGQLSFDAPSVVDTSANQTYSTFRVDWTGSITTTTAGTYYFRLPSADGAILTIDGHRVLWAASYAGDADLNGYVNGNDIGNLIGWGYYGDGTGGHTWDQGDWTGDGYVNGSDTGWLSAEGHYNDGTTVTAHVIDDTVNYSGDGGLAAGISLSAGTHTFSLEYFQFHDPTSFAELQWATPTHSGFYDMNSVAPVVSAVSAQAAVATPFNGAIATFTASAPLTQSADYTAAVNWGDGSTDSSATSSNVAITRNANGTFSVAGAHTYSALPGQTATVSVTHNASGFNASLPLALTVVPVAAPTQLATSMIAGGVQVTWQNPTGSTGTHVQRSTNGGQSWTTIANLSTGVTSLNDLTAPLNTSVSYRAGASSALGDGPVSGSITQNTSQMQITTSQTISDITDYSFLSEVRSGSNGYPQSTCEYDVGSNYRDLVPGRITWDTNLADGLDSGNIPVEITVPAGGCQPVTWNVQGGWTGQLSYNKLSYGTLNKVVLRLAVQGPQMDMQWQSLGVSFYHNGVDLGDLTQGNIEASTINTGTSCKEKLVTFIPPTNSADEVIVTGAVRLQSTQPNYQPDGNEIFSQVMIYANNVAPW